VSTRSAESSAWLDGLRAEGRLVERLPEIAGMKVERFRFPKIRSCNLVFHGLNEERVAAATPQDVQAKTVGESLRANVVDVLSGLFA
jgi:hypothetical protein